MPFIYSNWSNNTCDNHIHRLWQRFCIGELQRQFHHSSNTSKNYFKDYLKDNLKKAKSYEEVNYTSSYNYSKGCYEVTLKYRATNSFGALVLEQASGDVYFQTTQSPSRMLRQNEDFNTKDKVIRFQYISPSFLDINSDMI